MTGFDRVARLISTLAIVAAVLWIVRSLPIEPMLLTFQGWLGENRTTGLLVFALTYAVATVLMFPVTLFTIAASAVFGAPLTTAVVSIAATAGAAAAFLIARTFGRARVERLVADRPKLKAIDAALRDGGWKVVALLRLSPAVPFNLQNYFYGLTPIRFWPCVLVTWLAMIPATFMFASLGEAAGVIVGSRVQARPPAYWVLLGVGFVATVIVMVFLTRLARRRLAEITAEAEDTKAGAAHADDDADADAQRVTSAKRRRMTWVTMIIAAASLGIAACAHSNRNWLASLASSLFGPPSVTMNESYARKADSPDIDHTLWNDLLGRHGDDAGWVDYEGFASDRAELDAYIEFLAAAPFDAMGRDQRLALLINAYNAFTIALILEHWPLASIRDIPAAQRWDDVRWNIGGHTWSLAQIEHEQIRPHFREPRIHFALVCAAGSCPILRNEAYAAERLEQQLADQAAYVHTHLRWLEYDPHTNVVHLTELYSWYGDDFEQTGGSVIEFIGSYVPTIAERVQAGDPPRIEWITYDWSLNDIANRPDRTP